jgi:hypothetical protein
MKGTIIMKQIIFSLLLLCLLACSKEEKQVVSQCGEDMMPPSAEFIKEWEKKQGEVKVQMAAKRHPQTRAPKVVQRNQPQKKTSVPAVRQPRHTITPGARFTELCGRGVDWAIDPNRYTPRTLEGSQTHRIDSFCMGRDYRVIHKIFGAPSHSTHDTWVYAGMKVKYLAAGGRHTLVHIVFRNGKVCQLTTNP